MGKSHSRPTRHPSEPLVIPAKAGIGCRRALNEPYGRLDLLDDQQLYTGVAADLAARVTQHKNGEGSKFCRRYGLDMLVLAEHHADIRDAIAREKAIKAWKRDWKIELIEASNPEWRDLSGDLAGL